MGKREKERQRKREIVEMRHNDGAGCQRVETQLGTTIRCDGDVAGANCPDLANEAPPWQPQRKACVILQITVLEEHG